MKQRMEAEEKKLWEAYWADRSDEARNAVFEYYWDSIQSSVKLSAFRRHQQRDYDEIISFVSDRVLKSAIPNYVTDRGLFRSYLRHHVRGAILDFIRQKDSRSRGAFNRNQAMRVARDQLSQSLGYRPSDAELAKHLGIPEVDVMQAETSLDQQGDWPENSTQDNADLDKIKLAAWPSTEDKRGISDSFCNLTRGLPWDHRHILWLFYLEGYTMREIAEQYRVTESLISQRVTYAKKFLKENRSVDDF